MAAVAAALPSAAAIPDDAQLLAQAGSLSQGLLAEGSGSSLRSFTFRLDLQHFAAGARLPLNLAKVVLELELPEELAGLIQKSNGRLPPRLAPLRTPAVQVARGSEVALPGGRAACDFTAGLMSVATLLAKNPVMTIDVRHQERLSEDLLLGRAHVPLAPLLQESWVDGQASVYAMVPTAADPSKHERVRVGTVHLVMSLEETGPAPLPGSAPGTAAVSGAASPVRAPRWQLPTEAQAQGPASPAVLAARLQQVEQQQQQQQQLLAAVVSAAASPQRPASPVRLPAAGLGGATVTPLQTTGPPAPDCIAGPEFQAAWQLEVWKKEEEEKWRRELREREGKRMAALEDAWRQREAEREAEAASLRSEMAAVDGKARQVLAEAEERQKKVVAAEEAVARQRRELEREHAGRVAEAEAAVRRLQAECQHQLELEQQRREALAKQQAAAEARAADAEAKAAAAERALQQHREQHDKGEASRLEAELAGVRQHLAAAEQRAAKAAEAKRKYKEQVVRLAQEVGQLQQQLAELAGMKRRQLDAELAQLQAQEQALAARRDAVEISALKQQLHSLQLSGSSKSARSDSGQVGAAAAAAAAAAGPAGAALGAAPSPNSSSVGSVAAGGLGGAGFGGLGLDAGSNKENSSRGAAGHGHTAAAGAGGAAAPAPAGQGQQPRLVVLQGQLGEAVQRLTAERELLLGSGAYSPDDPLIAQLDQRIRECAALAQGGLTDREERAGRMHLAWARLGGLA